ncbi:glycosyltransferase [Parablautia muri]|uniref:Glycosyltransferase n=1 Tax=Parablautia muri TaxID=2320879 RepID=A0A9X5GS01_9FIRM|nr:glycosyltransferase [Parablautia muri]NBJ92666.1 glycosyltransferase [Parablautia muri]
MLSIIIPVYNVEKYLEQCLESIISDWTDQKPLIEVLIINDGSRDRSGEISDYYAKKYSFIRVIHQANMGVAAARNTGMEAANGEWLYFVDSDDYLTTGAMDILLRRCAESADNDIVLFDAWKNVGEKEFAWEHFGKEATWDDKQKIRALQKGVLYFPGLSTKVPLAAPWDKVYKREFLLRKGIHFQTELKVLDDMIFNMEAFGAADKISYYKDKIYHYRMVPDSITNSYKPDRVEQDSKVWKYLEAYMEKIFRQDKWEQEEKDGFIQAYYCRIIKSFSICCRLCFFNPRNKNKLKNKLKYVKEVLKTTPYKEAFHKVRLKNAEWKLKIVILMGRCQLSWGIYLLHLAENSNILACVGCALPYIDNPKKK